jgi:hypothetical protein
MHKQSRAQNTTIEDGMHEANLRTTKMRERKAAV